jgi:hypothetical protein
MGALPKPQPDVCSGCGKLFPRIGVKLCATCALDSSKRFSLVRDLLQETPGLSVGDIVEATGLPRQEINGFYDNNRLIEVTPDLSGSLRVCTCGGRTPRCPKCQYELSNKLRSMKKSFEGNLPSKGQWAGGGDEDEDRVRYVRRSQRLSDE